MLFRSLGQHLRRHVARAEELHAARDIHAGHAGLRHVGQAAQRSVGLGVDVTGGMQFFGPRNMAPEVLAKINAALATALKDPDVAKLYADGASEIVASSAAEHAVTVKEQYERWGAVIRKLGLKLD